MIKIHHKPKKWLKYPRNQKKKKKDQKTLKTKKMTEIPPKPQKALMDIDFLWTKMEDGHQTLFQIIVNEE